MSARALDFIDDTSIENQSFKGNARPLSLNEKDISRFRSLISAPVKGMAKSVTGFAKMLPMMLQGPNLIPYLLTGHSIIPSEFEDLYKKGIEKTESSIEKALPTRPEFLEKALERGGELFLPALGSVATGGASLLGAAALSGAGGLGGQVVEELGGGPLLQTLAETTPFALPSLARKIIPSNLDQKKIVDLGRKYGMTEEQLAPLMPEAAKKKFFGKYASAGEGAQEALKQTRSGVQNIYQTLETSPAAKQLMKQVDVNQFVNDMNKIGKKMPFNIRSQVKNDAIDFVKSTVQKGGVSGEELMNFYHDISSRYNLGRSQLELFKQPIKDALKTIDPHLAHDFETVNRMYQKSMQIGRTLRPSDFEELISLGEAYAAGTAVAQLNPGLLAKILGLAGFRKFSEKMLTSPRLQNLIHKTQIAVQSKNLPIIKKFGDQLLKEFEEKD